MPGRNLDLSPAYRGTPTTLRLWPADRRRVDVIRAYLYSTGLYPGQISLADVVRYALVMAEKGIIEESPSGQIRQ